MKLECCRFCWNQFAIALLLWSPLEWEQDCLCGNLIRNVSVSSKSKVYEVNSYKTREKLVS